MGIWKYASLKSMDVTHSAAWREVLIVSGVSILNFSALRNLLLLLRSSRGLHLLFRFGTKNSQADAMPLTGRGACEDLHSSLRWLVTWSSLVRSGSGGCRPL